jgi:hypothetical protein
MAGLGRGEGGRPDAGRPWRLTGPTAVDPVNGRGPARAGATYLLSLGRRWQGRKLAPTAMRKLALILNALVRAGQPWRAPPSA